MLSFLFPPVCPLCGKTLLDKGQRVCDLCSKEKIFITGPVCYSCGKPLKKSETEYCDDCRKYPKNFNGSLGLCIYKDPVRKSLSAIKYKNKRIFAEYYLEEIRKRKLKQLKKLHADAIVPVPLYAKKRRKRGFNQAEIFAEGIGKMLGCPVEKNMVERKINTKPQKILDPQSRKKNLLKAFVGSREVYRKAGCPEKVLVVDDIYTTGATAQGVTAALKALGVKEVYIFCIAIGEGNS